MRREAPEALPRSEHPVLPTSSRTGVPPVLSCPVLGFPPTPLSGAVWAKSQGGAEGLALAGPGAGWALTDQLGGLGTVTQKHSPRPWAT